MICESIDFNSYKENNLITFETTAEKTENSSNKKKNNFFMGQNDILKTKINDKCVDLFNPVTRINMRNENLDNPSNNIPKKVINNYLFITKNVLQFRELNIKKEFLTDILLGLKNDEKINIPCYSNNILNVKII